MLTRNRNAPLPDPFHASMVASLLRLAQLPHGPSSSNACKGRKSPAQQLHQNGISSSIGSGSWLLCGSGLGAGAAAFPPVAGFGGIENSEQSM